MCLLRSAPREGVLSRTKKLHRPRLSSIFRGHGLPAARIVLLQVAAVDVLFVQVWNQPCTRKVLASCQHIMMWGQGECRSGYGRRGHAAVSSWAGRRLLRVAKEVRVRFVCVWWAEERTREARELQSCSLLRSSNSQVVGNIFLIFRGNKPPISTCKCIMSSPRDVHVSFVQRGRALDLRDYASTSSFRQKCISPLFVTEKGKHAEADTQLPKSAPNIRPPVCPPVSLPSPPSHPSVLADHHVISVVHMLAMLRPWCRFFTNTKGNSGILRGDVRFRYTHVGFRGVSKC